MTREEAIARLKANREMFVFEETKQALDMAIEALSQPIVAKHFDIQSGYIYCSPQDAENVKVVARCKDCRYWNSETNGCKRNPSVEAWHEDDFCSYGERREP